MYSRIMVPIDLGHVADLEKARGVAAHLSKQFGAPVTYVGVTATAPTSVAHSPQEFEAKLKAFAEGEASSHGIEAGAHAVASRDPSIDLDDALLKAIKDTGADLVVMQSHMPNITDYVWPSNGGTVAARSDASVFVVR